MATILILIVVFYAVCNSLRYEEWINNKKKYFSEIFRCFFNLVELISTIKGESCEEETIKYSFVLSGDDSLWGPNMMMLAPISHFLLTFNSSINFAIYCIKVMTRLNNANNVVLI